MPTILLPILKTAVVAFGSKLIGASVSEKLIAELFFTLAKWLAAHSTNSLDDQMLEKIKQAYYGE